MSESSYQLPQPEQGETGPYVVIVTLHTKSGMADELREHLLALHEATNREPGALAVNLHRDRLDPSIFVLYEVWRDVEALASHLTQPHAVAFTSLVEDYLVKNKEIRLVTNESIGL